MNKELTLDIETTGLPAKGADYKIDYRDFPRIVSVVWKIDDGPSVRHIINQEGFIIPEEVIAIHGITNEMAAHSIIFLPDVLRELLIAGRDAGRIIGHGLYFDTSTIKANVLRTIAGAYESEIYKAITELLHKDKRVDTMQKTVKFCGLGKYPTLVELHQRLFGESFTAHIEKNDVDATYRCYKELQVLGVIG